MNKYFLLYLAVGPKYSISIGIVEDILYSGYQNILGMVRQVVGD